MTSSISSIKKLSQTPIKNQLIAAIEVLSEEQAQALKEFMAILTKTVQEGNRNERAETKL